MENEGQKDRGGKSRKWKMEDKSDRMENAGQNNQEWKMREWKMQERKKPNMKMKEY